MTINVWSDSMQHIELLGKPALFSDSRVDRSTVPDGWYVYDLRGSDYDPDLISTLEARVIVNYAGSILTPEPVIFPDGQDYLDVKGQTDFLDEEITLIDFCRQHEMPIPSRYQIRPASFDEAGLFYAMKPEEDQRLGCIGHVRMDFGHRGKEFWHTWWPRGPEELNSPEFKAELQQVVDELRTGVLKDLSSMSKYCWSHGGEVGNWPSNYGYIVETENYRYHPGALCAATSRELERTFSIKGTELRQLVNQLRRAGIPIASNSSGYFYAATEQEVRATIGHLTRRISGIAAAIHGLNRSLEQFDTDQTRLPLKGGDGN